MTADALALGTRAGLPDALRVLLEEYPREGWSANPSFAGLVKFWLQRHLMFRRLLDELDRNQTAFLDDATAREGYLKRLGQYGSVLVGELHGHHQIEDMHYFPILSQRDPRLRRGFDVLDADHHALDATLSAFTAAANAVLSAPRDLPDPKVQAATFGRSLASLASLLDRHLIDEEELVVPVVLKFGESGLG